MRSVHNKLLALTLAAIMVFSVIPVQSIRAAEGTKEAKSRDEEIQGEEIQYERIDISTAEQFAAFASKCYIDSWSENKYVSLKADIDLTGTEICVVPVFNGIFDGVGHTISGFNYQGDGYVVGLFRYVESKGVVQNLTVKGDIESKNQKECIGSICGVNYGTIKSCTFQGTVSGRDTVGGIAGINGNTGVITGCSTKGRITGYYSTGGIVGVNHGTLNYCSNRAGINDNSAWVEEDDEMGTGMGIIESLAGDEDSELYSGVDTGGIAGFSDGVITRCTNAGTVGYEHTGYNIGGIAGRQSGVVSMSTNNGTVYGRKDVGGIVGQMEPFIEINEAESLRAAVDKLHDLIDKTIDDIQATKDGVKRDFDVLTSYSDGAVDAADALAEQIGSFVDDNIDQAQVLSDRVGHVMDMTPEVFDDFEAAENNFTNAVNALKNVSADLGEITSIGDGAYDTSKDKRVTLLHTVGGYVISNSYNPNSGEEVKITAEADDSQGDYRLSRIDVIKVTNGEKIATSNTSPCTFTMPAENVRVEAYFEPGAGIAVEYGTLSDKFDKNPELPDIEIETESSEEESTIESDSSIESSSEEESITESISEEDITESISSIESSSEEESITESSSEEEGTTEGTSSIESSSEEEGITESSSEEEGTTESTGSIESSSEEESDIIENGNSIKSGSEEKVQEELRMRYGAGAAFLDGAAGDEASSAEKDTESSDKASSIEKDTESSDKASSTEDSNTDPAMIQITSNLSGSASCLVNKSKDKATITAEPTGGYAVDSIILNESQLSPDNGNSYSFPITSGGAYKVSISFKKITTKSGTVENAKSEIEYAIKEAQDAANKINDRFHNDDRVSAAELQKMLSAITTVMENTEILADIYGSQAADSLRAVNRDLSGVSEHLKNALDGIKAATRHTRDIADYVNAQPAISFTKLGAEYDYNRTNLHNHLEAISNTLTALSDNASNNSDMVNADLKAVNDQINVIFNLLADRISDAQKLELEAFYKDVDTADIDSITTGRAESCSNKGLIKGDIHVGGIAGAMSIDDEDFDDSAARSIQYEPGRRFIMKCLVTDSVNEGYVTAKKNGAGGICGYMNHGIIVDSESYGSVESTEGDYVGGICGESLTVIERCYTLCAVMGNKNVGGIAGYAETLRNCYSMADVQSENGRAGAIAGQVSGYDIINVNSESEETDEPRVANNYYVGENVHGIDNISYMGIAEPISYQDLLAVEQLPTQFLHLKVIYKIEDTYLGSEEVKYGEKLDKLSFPQIPSKEGFYGEWPDVSDKVMSGTMVVEAEYKDNVTVVQSKGDEDRVEEGQWNKPYALVEDIFTESTVLNAKISDMAAPEEMAKRENVIYEVTLENNGISEGDSFALRILNPYEEATVYGYKDGMWTELESKSRGQYLQVNMTGTQEYFCVAKNTSNTTMIIVCAAASAVVLIVLIVLIKRQRARRRQKLQQKLQNKAEKSTED